jgi:hypothetical protein
VRREATSLFLNRWIASSAAQIKVFPARGSRPWGCPHWPDWRARTSGWGNSAPSCLSKPAHFPQRSQRVVPLVSWGRSAHASELRPEGRPSDSTRPAGSEGTGDEAEGMSAAHAPRGSRAVHVDAPPPRRPESRRASSDVDKQRGAREPRFALGFETCCHQRGARHAQGYREGRNGHPSTARTRL